MCTHVKQLSLVLLSINRLKDTLLKLTLLKGLPTVYILHAVEQVPCNDLMSILINLKEHPAETNDIKGLTYTVYMP